MRNGSARCKRQQRPVAGDEKLGARRERGLQELLIVPVAAGGQALTRRTVCDRPIRDRLDPARHASALARQAAISTARPRS
jgi:hypothetical protein